MNSMALLSAKLCSYPHLLLHAAEQVEGLEL